MSWVGLRLTYVLLVPHMSTPDMRATIRGSAHQSEDQTSDGHPSLDGSHVPRLQCDANPSVEGPGMTPIPHGAEATPIAQGLEMTPIRPGATITPIAQGTGLTPSPQGAGMTPIPQGLAVSPEALRDALASPRPDLSSLEALGEAERQMVDVEAAIMYNISVAYASETAGAPALDDSDDDVGSVATDGEGSDVEDTPTSSLQAGAEVATHSADTVVVPKKARKEHETAAVECRNHSMAVDTSHQQFTCTCKVAKQHCLVSCLEQFRKPELRRLHQETYYGVGKGPNGPVHISTVSKNVHTAMWSLATPNKAYQETGEPDDLGRMYHIQVWSLLGRTVCRPAWQCAVGGGAYLHRTRLYYVMRGHSPASLSAAAEARLELKLFTVKVGLQQDREGFAVDWWSQQLRLHSWLPNENALQFKGPTWAFMHKQVYAPYAEAHSGSKPLKYTAWKSKMYPGLHKLAATLPDLAGQDFSKFRIRRSARHSNFPECTKCSQKRARYQKLCSTPGADPQKIQEALDELTEHMDEWKDDRDEALRRKYASYGQDKDTAYEGDDKCGSHWCKAPVNQTGRDNKANTKAAFEFSIQSNVVVGGGGGVNRVTIVPKHIKTGANFGLTCLIMALGAAFKSGRLSGQNSPGLYRHTDGGSDNLSRATHIFHWLLVWLGAFQWIEWFRFEAGHSHTEISDRLFGMMKKIFQTDSQARPTPVGSMGELKEKVEALFAASRELTQVSYLFANWDFNDWFAKCNLEPSKQFAGITFDNVFRYEYKGASHWWHGGVMVTCKPRISYSPNNPYEAEWGPVERRVLEGDTWRSVGTSANVDKIEASGEAANSAPAQRAPQRNVTAVAGLQFIKVPPNIKTEPLREDFEQPGKSSAGRRNMTKAAQVCDKVVAVREGTPDALGEEECLHWRALADVFREYQHAGALPDMPITRRGIAFDGLPRKLLPILRDLRRFERPLITWDPLSEPAPSEWQDPSKCGGSGAGEPKGASPTEHNTAAGGLRDPRSVNHVTHAGYTKTQRECNDTELMAERWAAEVVMPVQEVKQGALYIAQLGAAEGEYKLGLVEAGPSTGTDSGSAVKPLWFERVGKAHDWGIHPSFKPWQRSSEQPPLSRKSFLLAVEDSWLVDPEVKMTAPQLNSKFMVKLTALAIRYGQELKAPPKKKRTAKRTAAEEGAKGPSQPPTGATGTSTTAAAPQSSAAATAGRSSAAATAGQSSATASTDKGVGRSSRARATPAQAAAGSDDPAPAPAPDRGKARKRASEVRLGQAVEKPKRLRQTAEERRLHARRAEVVTEARDDE